MNGSKNTVNRAAFRFREAHLAHLHPIADRLFETGQFARLGLFFDFLLDQETEWTACGDSDGFFVYSLIRGYTQRAIEAGRTDLTSFLLDYQTAHFDETDAEEADALELDYAFGLVGRPRIYYSPGCTVEFGIRPAGNETEGTDFSDNPLFWTVLVQEESRVLLLSKAGLAFRPFHGASQDVTWADSDVRTWLNTDFFEQAFSPEEQARIPAVSVHTPDNVRFNAKGGPDTVDRVFLLSTEEAETLIPDVHSRIRTFQTGASPANAAGTPGSGSPGSDTAAVSWLLRSPGDQWLSTACVRANGRIDTSGVYVYQTECSLCPALWMTLPSPDDFL